MKIKNQNHLYYKLQNLKKRSPLIGQIELTYRCNLNCIHCYCSGLGNNELSASQFKKILKEIYKEGCLFLCFTGGEPLLRKDFLEIYSYARQKGFIITIFTNGLLLKGKILDYLKRFPPYSIEITINGITKDVYESITQVKGSFEAMKGSIAELKKSRLNVIFKSNCLKQNKDEIFKIKAFTDKFLGKRKERWKYKYDIMILPKLNGDPGPCSHRVSPEDILSIRRSDPEMQAEYEKNICNNAVKQPRDKDFIYDCTSWHNQFFIDPGGRLKFCQISNKYSTDLKTDSFAHGFYNTFPKIVQEKFKRNSKCRNCDLRPMCYFCPSRSFLETGIEEGPIDYFCRLSAADKKY